jgi:hypothetical protein
MVRSRSRRPGYDLAQNPALTHPRRSTLRALCLDQSALRLEPIAGGRDCLCLVLLGAGDLPWPRVTSRDRPSAEVKSLVARPRLQTSFPSRLSYPSRPMVLTLGLQAPSCRTPRVWTVVSYPLCAERVQGLFPANWGLCRIARRASWWTSPHPLASSGWLTASIVHES